MSIRDVVDDEDGGWARLAGCPYGVQGNNRWGMVAERPHHRSWHHLVSSGSGVGVFQNTKSADQRYSPMCAWRVFPSSSMIFKNEGIKAFDLIADKQLIET